MKRTVSILILCVVTFNVIGQIYNQPNYLDTCSYITAAYYYLRYDYLKGENYYIIKDGIDLTPGLKKTLENKYNLFFNYKFQKKDTNLITKCCNCYIDPITSLDSLKYVINTCYKVDSAFFEVDSLVKSIPEVIPGTYSDTLWNLISAREDFLEYRRSLSRQAPKLIFLSSIHYIDIDKVGVVAMLDSYGSSRRHPTGFFILFRYNTDKERWFLELYRL